MSKKEDLLLLFQRPLEPSFFPKNDGKTSINLPSNFYTDRYKSIGQELQTRFGEEATNTINVAPTKIPEIKFAEVIKKDGSFSPFIPLHQKIAGQLIALFMEQPDVKTLFAVSAYCRDRLNPYLFQYAFAVAVQHRKDTKDLNIPNVVQTFPDQFVDPKAFPRLGEEGRLPQESRVTIFCVGSSSF